MRITKEQLKQIIKEEIRMVMNEEMDLDSRIRTIISTEPMNFEDLFDELYPDVTPMSREDDEDELRDELKDLIEAGDIELEDGDYKLA
tara:strand:+ start:41 stop:304 length:264 start_codon:yes stop_codon:yes gene_type:complete